MNSLPAVLASVRQLTLPAGQTIFSLGQPCNSYVVLMSGSVRVFTSSENGKELVLYRIRPGEICVLTTSCLPGNKHYPAEAITESEIRICMLSKAEFNQLIATDSEFRDFVFQSFSQRLADLITQLEQIALESVPWRLQQYLLKHADNNNRVHATHQTIAAEIGTAREVVSRHLKTLEKQQKIRLGRGSIEVLTSELQDSSTA